MYDIIEAIKNKTSYRIKFMHIIMAILFIMLVVKLYSLQITSGDYYSKEVSGTAIRNVTVSAPRGIIYDRYGREIATNTSSYAVNIDPSIGVDNLNDVLQNLITLLENNNEKIVIDFPITAESPHSFLFNESEKREIQWKKDMNIDENLTADEAFKALREQFEIDNKLSDLEASKLLGLRCKLYQQRYSKYIPLTIAYNLSEKTVTSLQEQASSFPCVYVDMQPLRNYPYGKYFAHILGYIGNITDNELKDYSKYNYTMNDVIGKDGIEKAYELKLNGQDGSQYIEVDSSGRRIRTVENEGTDPVAGKNVYLTVDSELQKKIYDALKTELRNAQLAKLSGADKYGYSITDVFKSMIKSDNVHIKNILNSKEGTVQNSIKKYIVSQDKDSLKDIDKARDLFLKGFEAGAISQSQVFLALFEQGQITNKDGIIDDVKSGRMSGGSALLEKIKSGEVTPQMTNMDPCTGSVVVTDVKTGGVLAAVSYPSYDNNELVNDFNNEYYLELQNDPTTPMVNRPFSEPRAPGSTFKMITATAGLQEGIISPNTGIYDKGTFKDAGRPYARCWIGSGSGSHGNVNVSEALEVSCNYFFYTVAYRMNKGAGDLSGINTLNKYMEAFGLNSPTGVEISELYDSMSRYPTHISSPEYKKYITQQRDADAKESDYKWSAGDTIRTAIGQSYNNYTSALMSKYVATLANGGTRYSMHFLNKVTNNDGKTEEEYQPKVESKIEIKKENLDAIFKGMFLVTTGPRGTLRNYFKDFPVDVAAKSGTAQQSSKRSEHTTFVAFAPLEDPQISVCVIIPFGNGTTGPAPKVAKVAISEYLKLDYKPELKSYDTLLH